MLYSLFKDCSKCNITGLLVIFDSNGKYVIEITYAGFSKSEKIIISLYSGKKKL